MFKEDKCIKGKPVEMLLKDDWYPVVFFKGKPYVDLTKWERMKKVK